jgi:hypothetical protein
MKVFSDFDQSIQSVITRVIREAAIDDHRVDFPWLRGYLGDPQRGTWFIAWYPSLSKVQGANRRGDSPNLQWSESPGDHVFRETLVKFKFKSGEPMSAGGWNCYITDLIKSPYDVGAYKSMSRDDQDRAIKQWSPVLREEIALGKPRVLVPMGDEVRDALGRFLNLSKTTVLVYPDKLWHYATLNYGPVTPAKRAIYERQFVILRTYLRSVAGG